MTGASRITVTIGTQDKVRWGWNALILLFQGYPDEQEEQRVVRVEDTAAGKRWTIEVTTATDARRVRDAIEERAARMSDVELDEWASHDRWATWA